MRVRQLMVVAAVLLLAACSREADTSPDGSAPSSDDGQGSGAGEHSLSVADPPPSSDAFDELDITDDATTSDGIPIPSESLPLMERYALVLPYFNFGAEDCETLEEMELTVRYPLCDFEVEYQRGTRSVLPSCGEAGGPIPEPRHVHIAYGSDRSWSDVSFNWMTGAENRVAMVEIGTSPDDLDMRFHGYTSNYSGIARLNRQHRVVNEVYVCGLEPATTYYYRVGAPDSWSDVYSFTTGLLPGDTTEFRFALTGDTRHETNEPWAQALEMIAEYAPDFHLFSGDAVDQGPSQPQWDSWFEASEPWLAEQFFMPANGNHEVMALNYTAQFSLPGDGENYFFRYGNALVIVVNDLSFTDLTSITGTVRTFLEETLTAHADATWKFVLHHRSVYSSSNHGSARELQEAWVPLFDEYGVDMVFNGHDHNYERTHPLRAGEVVPFGEGTVYLRSAGIGAPLYRVGEDYFTAVTEQVSSFVIVDVRGDELEVVARRLDGTELDRFTLSK